VINVLDVRRGEHSLAAMFLRNRLGGFEFGPSLVPGFDTLLDRSLADENLALFVFVHDVPRGKGVAQRLCIGREFRV
jgi:hypothetical protein